VRSLVFTTALAVRSLAIAGSWSVLQCCHHVLAIACWCFCCRWSARPLPVRLLLRSPASAASGASGDRLLPPHPCDRLVGASAAGGWRTRRQLGCCGWLLQSLMKNARNLPLSRQLHPVDRLEPTLVQSHPRCTIFLHICLISLSRAIGQRRVSRPLLHHRDRRSRTTETSATIVSLA